MRPLVVPRRALAVGAHPDDVEFGAGATLARWAAAGCEVHMLVLTDGSKGTWDPGADTRALVATRVEEQRHAADALGVCQVHWLGGVDGELAVTRELTGRVCEVIRRTRPDVLLGHDPWKRYRLHPDHRNAGWLTLDGVVAARDPHFFADQGVAPHRPHTVMLFEADEPDHDEPATDAAFDAKLEALMRHRSQWRSTHHIDDDPDTQIPAFADRVRHSKTALADGSLGETFKLITEV